MKKKIFLVILIVIFTIVFFVFGTYKISPQVLIENDGGLEILSSVESISITNEGDSINVFSCVVENKEYQEQQYLMYITNEKSFLGKTFYKAHTSYLCELDNITKEQMSENMIVSYISKDVIVYCGLAPENCKQVFINNKELTLEGRTAVSQNTTYNFVFYYGIFDENEIIENSYYIDNSGAMHEFELDVLYF